MKSKITILIIWCIFSYLSAHFVVKDPIITKGIFGLFFFVGLWLSEVIPLPVTALLVPVVAYLTHVLNAKEALAPFSSTIIFLFMGGFTLAALLNKYRIDYWLATHVIQFFGGRLWLSVVSFFAVCAFLSMWMSNTSTTAMMLPIAMVLIDEKYPRMRSFIVLGTAYSASIGGLATVMGSPPNGIAVAALNLSFLDWLKVGLPTSIMLFPIMLLVLKLVIAPEKNAKITKKFINIEPVVWTKQAKLAVVVFILTVFCWVFSSQFNQLLGVSDFDKMSAIAVTSLAPTLGLIEWKELEKKIDWGLLILFGGGLSLSLLLSKTGASVWLAKSLLDLVGQSSDWVIIFSCISLMIGLTEFASNTGSAAIMIPIMISLADRFNPSLSYALVFGVSIAATCAFMLPVATPPNALAYGSGCISQKKMIHSGILLNIASVAVVYFAVVYFL